MNRYWCPADVTRLSFVLYAGVFDCEVASSLELHGQTMQEPQGVTTRRGKSCSKR